MMRSLFNELALLICVLAAWSAGPGHAQAWPAKPVQMVVPFPPGGGADLVGRLLAQRLAGPLGQPVVVENRVGASGNLGAEAVARAAPDGHTILMAALTSHAINHTLERKTLRYDLLRDLVPVGIVATVPYVVVVHPSVPARSLQELVAAAKSRPGPLSYGSSGAGSPQRLAAEMFRLRTGIEMLHVPYKGSAQVITDLVGGHVLFAFESVPATLPHIRAGRLRALAVASARRLPMLPEVATMAESGVPEFEVSSTFGVLVPAGTPKGTVDRLAAEIEKILQLAEVQDKLLQQGALTRWIATGEAAHRISAEVAMWARVIRDANVVPD
jgi:tripartite-type tricarboxylate transporter receptor subunit TctC